MKILIAEDEPDIRLTYQMCLEDRGYEIFVTEDGEDCVKMYDKTVCQLPDVSKEYLATNPPFDVVILDYRMPKMNGLDAAKAILQINPRQRIIFASAYVLDTIKESIKELNVVVELLQKPFELDTLIDTIEDKRVYYELQKINVNVKALKGLNPSHDQIKELLEELRSLHLMTPLLNT